MDPQTASALAKARKHARWWRTLTREQKDRYMRAVEEAVVRRNKDEHTPLALREKDDDEPA